MLLLSTVLTLAGVAAGQYVPDYGDFAPNEALRAAEMQRYWESDLPVPAGENAVSATVVDDALYVLTDRGSAVALDAATGLPLWSRNLNEGRSDLLPPTHIWGAGGPGPTVVVGGRRLWVLDRPTGRQIAQFPLPFANGSPAVGDDQMLYMGSADGKVHAMRWDTTRAGGPAIHIWEVATGGPVRPRPSFDGRNLFFGSSGGMLASCVAHNRLRNWVYQTDGGVNGAVIVHETGVYAATVGRAVLRLDAESGERKWSCRMPVPLQAGPVVAGQTVYQDCGDAGLHAIDVDTGTTLWNQPMARSFVAHQAGEVVALSMDGQRLMVLDAGTGEVRRGLDVFGARTVASNPGGDAVFCVTKMNRVVCLRPATVPYLTVEALASARARLAAAAQGTTAAAP